MSLLPFTPSIDMFGSSLAPSWAGDSYLADAPGKSFIRTLSSSFFFLCFFSLTHSSSLSNIAATIGPANTITNPALPRPRVPTDFVEFEDSYTLFVELPGVEKKDVEINLEPDTVTVICNKHESHSSVNDFYHKRFVLYSIYLFI